LSNVNMLFPFVFIFAFVFVDNILLFITNIFIVVYYAYLCQIQEFNSIKVYNYLKNHFINLISKTA
jgi:hypothetical protein